MTLPVDTTGFVQIHCLSSTASTALLFQTLSGTITFYPQKQIGAQPGLDF